VKQTDTLILGSLFLTGIQEVTVMKKMHTKEKRAKNLSRSHHHKERPKTTVRPKTFKTEASANTWAEKNGVTKFTLEPAKKNKKFKIIAE